MDETANDYTGEILLERVRNTRPIRSFIQKRIRGWLDAHGFGGDRGAHYRIALNKHRQGHMFTCRVEIDGANSRWSALVTAPDLHQAILSALNHMAAHPTPLAKEFERRMYAQLVPAT